MEREARAHATAMHKLKTRGLLGATVLAAGVLAFMGVQREHTQSNRAERAEASQKQTREGQREMGPRLRQRMQQLTSADDMREFDRFAHTNECRGQQIAHMLNGNAPTDNCSGSYAPENGMRGAIRSDSISFSYQRDIRGQNGQGGFVTSNVTVQPITNAALDGVVGSTVSSPLNRAVGNLGMQTMRGFAEQGRCAVVQREVTASFNFRSENAGRPLPTTTINGGQPIKVTYVGCLDNAGNMTETEAPTAEAMARANAPQAEAPTGNVLTGNNRGRIRFGRPGAN